MLFRLLLFVAIQILASVMVPLHTDACECEEGSISPIEYLNMSRLVFRGIVTSVDDEDNLSHVEIDFDVLTVWKGEIAKRVTV